jgi:hypothetical protein
MVISTGLKEMAPATLGQGQGAYPEGWFPVGHGYGAQSLIACRGNLIAGIRLGEPISINSELLWRASKFQN